MGLETIRMRDLEGKAENMYEAVTVMAKRAKHINNVRLSKKEEILDHDDTEEYSAEPIVPIISTVKETNTDRATRQFSCFGFNKSETRLF